MIPCTCEEIAYQMVIGGAPNPESAMEWKEAHGHFYECLAGKCLDEHGGTGLVCNKSKDHSGRHLAYWGPAKSWVFNW